jgi:hypothetical protein
MEPNTPGVERPAKCAGHCKLTKPRPGTPTARSVFVPTGSPRNPHARRNWEGEGVQPDVDVAASDALNRAHELVLRE